MTESILEESKRAKGKGILGFFNFKSKKFLILVAIIAISGGGYFFMSGDEENKQSESEQKTYTAKKGDITTAVESEGQVVAEDGVELSFSVTGDTLEVDEVFVKEGDEIKKGDQIASVKTDSLEYDLTKAYASYQSALANYNEDMVGATEEDIEKSLASVETAKINLEQQKISFEKTKISAQNKIDVAEDTVDDTKENLEDNKDELTSEDVNEEYEDLVSSIKSINISLESLILESDEILGIENKSLNDDFEDLLGVLDKSSLNSAKNSYINAENEKDELNIMTIALSDSSDYADIDEAAEQAKDTLDIFEDHLYYVGVLLDNTITANGLTQYELDSFKASINSNRSSVNTKISTLNTDIDAVDDAKEALDDYLKDYEDALEDFEEAKIEAEQDIANAEASLRSKEISLRSAELNHEELLAPLTEAELASARSSLTSAAITVDKAKDAIEDAILSSPIDGTVARLNYMIGDIILKDDNTPVVEIINKDTLFIEVDIEEADINKLEVGQKAIATFDALDSANLQGEISFISLTSETSNNGIVTYLVRVVFENSSESQVREGMTAYVEFITSGVENVLMVPVDAVRNVDGKPSVLKDTGEWVAVTTGFTDGKSVELISGIAEGDKIIY